MKYHTPARVLVCLAALAANAGEPPEIVLERATLGGAGDSAGDVFDVVSTVGQPDATPLTGGVFESEPGFWKAAAAAEPGGLPFADGFEGN